jgi:hypothetical protein
MGIRWLWKGKLCYVLGGVHQPDETSMQVHCRGVEPNFLLTKTAGVSSGWVKNFLVHCLVHSVALWNVLLMNSALLSKETSNITFPFDAVSMESLFLWRGQGLSVHWPSLSLWLVKVNPCFITCDYSVPQPWYFHDLALTNYYRFSRLEEWKGWLFATSDDIEAATMAALNGVTTNGMQDCFQKWYTPSKNV